MKGAENIYWVFSAAAQSVAAFVAFLLAGYALVHTMMEAATQVDDTLLEIHDALKEKYHRMLSRLVVVTACSILASLSVVFLNVHDVQYFGIFVAIAGMLTAISIIGGVVFVIAIVDPSKYKKAAKRLAREVQARPQLVSASSSEFFVKFVELERLLRRLWEVRAGDERLTDRQGHPTLREILQVLLISEILPKGVVEDLAELNRYRNLVFHGHLTEIRPEVVQRLDKALIRLRDITNMQ